MFAFWRRDKIDGTRRISGGDMNEAYGMTYLPGVKRILLVLAGILLIGMCVAFYRMSGFEVDTFSCMNLGVSGFLKMPFGNWQLIVNAVLLIVVWLTVRHCIGPGTVVNMVGDFFCRSFQLLSPPSFHIYPSASYFFINITVRIMFDLWIQQKDYIRIV